MSITDNVDTFVDSNDNYIGGEWVPSEGSARITITSPSTEEAIGSVVDGTEGDMDRAVAAARAAFDDPTGWSTWAPGQRAEVLERFAVALEARGAETASAVSRQNGMPLSVSSSVESAFPGLLLRYYSGLVAEPGFLESTRPAMFGGLTTVRREALGVVAAIIPWNFPQALAFTKLAPALAMGNTVVMKPSPETVLDSLIVGAAAIEAGLPAGVLNIVPAGREVGAYLVSHPGVDKVAFTGSSAAGRQIAAVCGGLLRPVTLELGGKSAALVLEDADLVGNAAQFLNATMPNNGQTCNASTRILVPHSKYAAFVDDITDMVKAMKVGDALDPETQVGPMVSARQRDRVMSYVDRGRADGARVTTGGGRPDGVGYFVQPTVFADVTNDQVIAQEEIFGPVLTVIGYSDEAEGIRLANDSEFGLGGSVWSQDTARAIDVARHVKTGSIGINSYVNDPASPFGGVKSSGMGREQGPEALSSYFTYKSIYNV
ncbi:MAG: NAD-dependent aldehyde dehydrogenase [Aeromicrobium sp.]|nr:NAD-dependent aldehyde dehydrogenase [Aeromicrobium sp.]